MRLPCPTPSPICKVANKKDSPLSYGEMVQRKIGGSNSVTAGTDEEAALMSFNLDVRHFGKFICFQSKAQFIDVDIEAYRVERLLKVKV